MIPENVYSLKAEDGEKNFLKKGSFPTPFFPKTFAGIAFVVPTKTIPTLGLQVSYNTVRASLHTPLKKKQTAAKQYCFAAV